MRVFVAGGTGVVGRRLVPQLVARGHQVTATTRPDVIVHQVTAIDRKADIRHMDRWFAAANRLRTEGTDHLLAAAEQAGAPQ